MGVILLVVRVTFNEEFLKVNAIIGTIYLTCVAAFFCGVCANIFKLRLITLPMHLITLYINIIVYYLKLSVCRVPSRKITPCSDLSLVVARELPGVPCF